MRTNFTRDPSPIGWLMLLVGGFITTALGAWLSCTNDRPTQGVERAPYIDRP